MQFKICTTRAILLRFSYPLKQHYFSLIFLVRFFFYLPIHYFVYKSKEETLLKGKFKELYAGVKLTKWFQALYMSQFIFKRICFVFLVFFVKDYHWATKVVPLFVIQLGSFSYLLIVRSFEDLKDNLIEIMNECFFLFFVGFNLFNYDEETWSKVDFTAMIYCMTVNSAMLSLIIVIDLVKSLIVKCKKRRAARNKKVF